VYSFGNDGKIVRWIINSNDFQKIKINSSLPLCVLDYPIKDLKFLNE
jgi:hypothetical protein